MNVINSNIRNITVVRKLSIKHEFIIITDYILLQFLTISENSKKNEGIQ